MKTKSIIFLAALIAALIAGLLFYCPKTYACEAQGGTLYLMPKAGFEEFIAEIEPVIPEPEEPLLSIEPTYICTDKEAELLVAIGVLEGGYNRESIGHVIQVVFNRVADPRFPNTIEEVIFQTNPRQFATAEKLATANVTPEAWAALDGVIFGEFTDNQCLYFESEEGLSFSGWATYVFSFGGHDFYK